MLDLGSGSAAASSGWDLGAMVRVAKSGEWKMTCVRVKSRVLKLLLSVRRLCGELAGFLASCLAGVSIFCICFREVSLLSMH